MQCNRPQHDLPSCRSSLAPYNDVSLQDAMTICNECVPRWFGDSNWSHWHTGHVLSTKPRRKCFPSRYAIHSAPVSDALALICSLRECWPNRDDIGRRLLKPIERAVHDRLSQEIYCLSARDIVVWRTLSPNQSVREHQLQNNACIYIDSIN